MAGCDDDYDYSIEDWKTIDSVIDGDDERDAGGDDGWDDDHDDDIEDWRTIDMVIGTQHARRLEGSADLRHDLSRNRTSTRSTPGGVGGYPSELMCRQVEDGGVQLDN